MPRKLDSGVCEYCKHVFGYWLVHCGFGDCVYAYCDCCGKTAILSMWDKRMPKLSGCRGQQEICLDMEAYVLPCECGGSFKKGSAPRCPHCKNSLSANYAASYIEENAEGAKSGWRWQRTWTESYCIVIEDNVIQDNFRQTN